MDWTLDNGYGVLVIEIKIALNALLILNVFQDIVGENCSNVS